LLVNGLEENLDVHRVADRDTIGPNRGPESQREQRLAHSVVVAAVGSWRETQPAKYGWATLFTLALCICGGRPSRAR